MEFCDELIEISPEITFSPLGREAAKTNCVSRKRKERRKIKAFFINAYRL